MGHVADHAAGLFGLRTPVDAAEPANSGDPIKIGIIEPLSSPYKTSSIHHVHLATIGMDLHNPESSKRFIQGVIEKYNQTPTSVATCDTPP